MPNWRGIGPAGGVAATLALFLAGAIAIASPAGAQDAPATGFVMRNYAPFAAIIGIPGRWPDTSNNFFDLSWNASSHSMAERSGGFAALTDGETHTLTGRLQFEIGQWLRIGAQLPWIQHSGGFLDSTIDTWHDIFGLNEGVRPILGTDLLNYVLQRQDVDLFRLDDSVAGFGDLQLGMSGELGSFARFAKPGTITGYFLSIPWRATVNVKLPTGDIDKLTGSGNTDIAAGLGWRAPDKLGARFHWWLDLGIAFPGGVDIAGLDTESQVLYYDTAMTWRLVSSLDVILQFAGHSALYAGNVSMLGEPSAQAALGGLWNISPRFGLRFGIFEDILPESAPDFGIELALLIRRW